MVFSLVNQKSFYDSFSSLQRKQTPRTASGNPQAVSANHGPELVRNLLGRITQMPLCAFDKLGAIFPYARWKQYHPQISE
jgi:hypothetical protein